MALTHWPDLIISDLIMPEVDGYQMLTALQAEGSCALIPKMVLTEEIQKTVLTLSADDYLVKPFDADVLLVRVRSVFARHTPAG